MRCLFGDADGHGVDQDVAVVAAMKVHFAADGGNAEGVAVAADAGHHAGDQPAGFRVVGSAKPQGIEHGDRPCAHGEDVAQNAADAGRRTLIGLDVGRVIVALHLEYDRLAVTEVDDAGVLARSLDDPRACVGSCRSHFFEDL